QRVQVGDGVDRIERAALPGPDILEHRVGHAADQVRRDLDAVQVLRWPWMSRTVIPRAYRARMRSSKPASRRSRFLTTFDSNVPSRSRGTSMVTSPWSVVRIFDV